MNRIFDKVLGVVVGIVFIGFGVYFVNQTYGTVYGGAKTDGRVVDISRNYGKKHVSYAPVVEYSTSDGQLHRFTSTVGSSRVPVIGEKIPVIYNTAHPEQAVVDSFFQLYVFPGIFIIFGLLSIFLFTLLLPFISLQRRKRAERLRAMGHPVQAQIVGVAPTAYRVNRNPYYILSANWIDPITNSARVFHSNALKFDPTPNLQGVKEVTVYTNPSDPKDYWMDTTFIAPIDLL